MYTYSKNMLRHIVILILATIMLFPCVWLLNKSYYTSIKKVNAWEEKQIFALLQYILNNSTQRDVATKLKVSLQEVRFLAINIERDNKIILSKGIEGYQVDPSTTNIYNTNGYKVSISRRLYSDYLHDINRYFSCFGNVGIYAEKDMAYLLNSNKSLLYHHNLLTFITHITLIAILEIVILNISIKYRLNKMKQLIRS